MLVFSGVVRDVETSVYHKKDGTPFEVRTAAVKYERSNGDTATEYIRIAGKDLAEWAPQPGDSVALEVSSEPFQRRNGNLGVRLNAWRLAHAPASL